MANTRAVKTEYYNPPTSSSQKSNGVTKVSTTAGRGAAANEPHYDPTNVLNTRIKGSDRSGIKKVQVGATRSSTMPGSSKGNTYGGRETVDQTFRRRLAERTLGNSILKGMNNLVQEELKADDQTEKRSFSRKVKNFIRLIESLADDDLESLEDYIDQLPQSIQRLGVIRKILRVRAYIRAYRKSVMLWAWGAVIYLYIQLPMALLSLVFLGTTALLEEMTSTIQATLEPDPSDGTLVTYIVNGVKEVADIALGGLAIAAEAANAFIADNFGIDFATVLDPGTWFLVCMSVVVFVSLFFLFVIYFVYTIGLLRPLGGEKSGLKYGMLLLCFIGYFTPVLNILPWFVGWTLAVLRYPK